VLAPWAIESLHELVSKGEWEELNNRFYKKIEFGTAGMRGRTIGEKATSIEKVRQKTTTTNTQR
jgi:phosphoglucomutase